MIYNADGTRTLLSHQPSTQQLYPALTNRGSLGSQALATQLSALDSLMLDDNQAAAAAGRGAEDGESDADQSNNPLRHLSPAQRASMAVRTFNLRAGEHPLLRLVLQPPQDGLLQPGGSFGLLLDFRAAHSAPPGSQPVCLQVMPLADVVVQSMVCEQIFNGGVVWCGVFRYQLQEAAAPLLCSQSRWMLSVLLEAATAVFESARKQIPVTYGPSDVLCYWQVLCRGIHNNCAGNMYPQQLFSCP